MKTVKSNLMQWDANDPRWRKTWWGSYKTYHKMHDQWHELSIGINAWHWAKEEGVPQHIVEAAMREAWRIAPYRCDIHGVQMYITESARYGKAYRRALKQLTTKQR